MPPNAVLQTLNHVWSALDGTGVPLAIAGGIALAYWGNPRSTQDVDLAVLSPPSDRIDLVLREAGLRCKSERPKDLGLFHLVQWEFDPNEAFVSVELDLMMSTSEYYTAAFKRTQPVELEDVPCRVMVLSREDLVLHKLYANRLIDQADATSLVESHREELDWKYLDHWSRQLGLGDALREVIERAESSRR